ncbi:MAG: glycosyltransferase [Bacteroidales bacterium]|nr:glycosyltransferase [Bacteroidales bacterium]
MNPKISAITVCRNAAELIEATMLSVLNQKYDNIEYIIIDGASTDGTQDIVNKYYDRIAYFVSEPDKGIYDAMNKGLSHATGEWVNFMNAGDIFADDMVLADMFVNPINERIKVVGGNTNIVHKDRVEILYSAVYDVRHQLPFCHQSCFTRNYGWKYETAFKIAADYKVFYDILEQYGIEAFKAYDRVVANYRMEDSTTFQNLRKAKREYLTIQSVHKDWYWWKEYIKYILHRV